MFDEIRYELSDVEIDRNRNATITSMLKNYVSMTNDKTLIALNARNGTLDSTWRKDILILHAAQHAVSFCEDYKRLMINARHELILI